MDPKDSLSRASTSGSGQDFGSSEDDDEGGEAQENLRGVTLRNSPSKHQWNFYLFWLFDSQTQFTVGRSVGLSAS